MPSALSLANRDDKSDQNWVLKVVAESVRPHKRQFSERVSRGRVLRVSTTCLSYPSQASSSEQQEA